jgi:NADH:ubiquinone oxidoreductase subunit 6 (subunit J)
VSITDRASRSRSVIGRGEGDRAVVRVWIDASFRFKPILDAFGDDTLPDRGPAPTVALSDQFLSIYLVPFLAISFVLLAAAIGAIVLARKD